MKIKDLKKELGAYKLTKKEKIYSYVFVALNFLPLFVALIYCLIVTFTSGDVGDRLAGFLGGYVVSCLMLAPFFCMYYGVLSFVHTIVDEIMCKSKSKIMCYTIIIVSFALSCAQFISGITALMHYEDMMLNGPVIFMIVSSILVASRFFVCATIKGKNKKTKIN